MKPNQIIYWIATAGMCLIFLFSAGMYLSNYEMVVGFYEHLGFPEWMIYPSAIAKILGVIAILTKKSKLLEEWAYAGFFFDAAMAVTAHQMAGDGAAGMALFALIAVIVSRIFRERVNG